MPSRRSIITTLPVLALASPAIALGLHSNNISGCGPEKIATLLAARMRELHGGEWKITMDSKDEFVLIRRVP